MCMCRLRDLFFAGVSVNSGVGLIVGRCGDNEDVGRLTVFICWVAGASNGDEPLDKVVRELQRAGDWNWAPA